MRSKYRKDMHLIIKYRGKDSGDLIVGRIESVRASGDIIGVNLMTGSRFTKEVRVVDERMQICHKKVALEILTEAGGDKAKAKELAVRYAQALKDGAKVGRLSAESEARLTKALRAVGVLTEEELQEFLRRSTRIPVGKTASSTNGTHKQQKQSTGQEKLFD